MKKRIITLVLLVSMMLTFFVPASAAPPSTAKFTTSTASEAGYFLQVYNGGWKDIKNPKHYGTNSATTAMCLDHTKESPTGTQNYVRYSASSVYSTRTINGLYAILEHGYPYDSHGMSGNEIKAATSNAIRIWLRESEGIGYSYMTTGNIRAKSGYDSVYNTMVSLVNYARNADGNELSWSGKNITTTPSTVILAPNAAGTALTGTFTVNNPADSFSIDTSKLPSGVSITGSGDTRTITAPLGTEDITINNVLQGKSNKSKSNIYFYKPSYGSTYQPLIVWDYNADKTVVYGSLTLDAPSGGSIEIVKTDEDTGAKLSGAAYNVLNMSNGIVATLTTNNQGYAKTGMIPSGTYKLKETTAPNGYVLDTQTITNIVVSNSNTTRVNVTDKAQKGTITINKHDSESGVNAQGDADLDGAVFEILDSDNRVVDTLTIANNRATSVELALGNYTITETAAPIGYKVNPNSYPVTISYAGQNIAVNSISQTITNDVIKGDIKIIKSGDYSLDTLQENVKLENVMFEIRLKSDNSLFETVTTDSDGVAFVEDLPYGTYIVTEIAPPLGYRNAESVDVVIDTDEKEYTVNITNEAILSTIKIVKKDIETNEIVQIAGTKFQIQDSDGNTIVQDGVETFTTNETGTVSLPYPLSVGSYTLHEIAPPYGYYLDSTPIAFSIDETSSSEITLKQYNKLVRKQIRIIKSDKRDVTRRLEGAVFEISDDKGDVIDTVTTESDGTAVSAMLVYGDYTVKEIKPPVGFKVENDTQSISIDDSKDEIYEVEFQNYPTEITIEKRGSDTNKPLANTEVSVFDANDIEVYKKTTDENGVFTILEIPQGNYTFVETVAPVGYTLEPTVFTFSVDKNGADTEEIFFSNEPTEVVITKVDELTNLPLSNAEIEIYDAEGKVAFKGATGEDGTITITHLPVGTYTAVETKAPDGYILNGEIIEFAIDVYGEITGKTKITNSPTELNIFKVDYENNQPLSGAGFKIKNFLGLNVIKFMQDDNGAYWYDKEGTITEVLVDEKGEAVVHGLPFGNYWIEERTTPNGYYPTAPVKIEITEENNTDRPCEIIIANSVYVKLGLDRERWIYPLVLILMSVTVGGYVYLTVRRKKKIKK